MKHLFTQLQAPQIDPENGIIRAASLIEMGDAKGHFDAKGRQITVDEVTLEQIFKLCRKMGTVKLKADHGSGVFEIVGWADNFAMTASKVVADLHLYESEPQRNRLLEIATTNPHHMGISMEFTGADKARGTVCLSRCDEVLAAALVQDPAANSSLFSAIKPDEEPEEPEPNTNDTTTMADAPTTTDAPTDEDRLTKLETMFKAFAEQFAKKFSDDQDADDPPAPVATDPEKDPEGSDPTKTYENPDADIDDEATKKAELQAERIAGKFVKQFMAQVGTVQLQRPGSAGEPAKEKTFDDFVSAEAEKNGGNRVKAFQTLLSRLGTDETIRKAYAATRNIKTA